MPTFYDQRLNGQRPLAYVGVDSYQPSDFYTGQRAPTSADVQGFRVGSKWLNISVANPTNLDMYVLVAKTANTATWVPYGITSAGDVLFIAGNSGGNVGPTVGGTINLVGDGTSVSIAGNPGTETLTASLIGTALGFQRINMQIFTSNGVYTPSANMAYCMVEAVGGGGGGGGGANGALQAAAGAGGGAGTYARGFFSAATVGASQNIAIGTGGLGGTPGTGNGGNGNGTQFGTGGTILLEAGPGSGGIHGNSGANFSVSFGGFGGTGQNIGTFSSSFGAPGGSGFAAGGGIAGYVGVSGAGGASIFGQGGEPVVLTTTGASGTSAAGNPASFYGAGGSGGVTLNGGGNVGGGAGSPGVLIVTEFII